VGLVGAVGKCGMSGDASLEMRVCARGFRRAAGPYAHDRKRGRAKGRRVIAGALNSGDIEEKESEEWGRRAKGIDNGEPGSPPYYI